MGMNANAKILVVDDQMAVAMMLAHLLTRAGCEAKNALSAEKAMRLAQAEGFDLITLDVDMPGTNGFELFQRLKQIPHLAETPIVFVSGAATIENQQRGLDLGAADFIEKPFDSLSFASRILGHIRRQPEFS
jgi:DNA-binding response OmpR family regulator